MIDWYYRDPQSCKVGPLTKAEFDVCVVVGEIRPETCVWRSGLREWKTYAELLAQEDEGCAAQTSRQSARAPWSSSYRTLIAMGISPESRQPARSRVTTSGCTPHGVEEPQWAERAVECAPAERGLSSVILDREGADRIWLGRQFVRIALAGAVFVLVHYLWVERAAAPAVPAPVAKAEPTVLRGPPAPTLSASATSFPAAVEGLRP